MTKPCKHIFKLAAAISVAVVVGVIAQDQWDDEGLFALEELAVDEAVTGSLPNGDAGGDDLFDALFGGDSGVDDLVFDDDLGDLTASDVAVDAGEDAFDIVDSPVAFPDDVFGDTEDTGTGAAEDVFDDLAPAGDWGADELLDDMFTAGDQDTDTAVADTMDTAGLGDLFTGEIDAGGLDQTNDLASDDDLDDLFGELVDAEPSDPAPVAPAAAFDDGDDLDDLFGELVGAEPSDPAPVAPAPAFDDGDDLDDLFGALVDAEPSDPAPVAPAPVDDWGFDEVVADVEEEKGAAPLAGTPDTDIGDDLFDSFFGDDVTDVPPTPAPPVAPIAEVAAPVAPPVAPEQPSTPAFRDELALDDGLFTSLAEEGARAAQAPPARIGAPAPAVVVAPPAPVAVRETPAAPEDVVRPQAPEGSAAFEEAERLRRIARENHAVNSLERAESAALGRDYRRAVQLFEEALRTLPRRADLEPARARARDGLANAYFRHAAALVEMGELEGALNAAQGAVRNGHRRGPEAVRRIQARLDAPPPAEPPPTPTPRWEQDDFRRIDREIEEWLRRGREAYLTGEYERAILAFESVLARDPENKEAIRMMRASASRQYDRATMELDATRQRMMAAVRDTWNPRQYGLHEEPIDPEEHLVTEIREDERQRQEVIDKMKAIRIPELSFRQINVRDVLTFLQQQSVEFDPAAARADRTGVNIILQMNPGQREPAADAGGRRAPAARQDDFFGMPADDGGGGAPDEIPITFSALNMSLLQALETVVEIANLKYRIRGNVVMVVPRDAADGEIVHRMYDVLPSAIARLQDLSSAVAPRGGQRGGAGDFLALQAREAGGGEEVDLRTFFEEMGVQWPARSSIKFVRGLGKLVVANTQENLAVFENILSILNVVPYQIEIEARFIEVAQTDVDSLGLEWMLSDSWKIAEMAADANLPAAARRRVVMDSNQSTGGFTGGNRFLTGGAGGPLGMQMMDQVMSVSSVLTNPELTMVLHALQQRGHTDLLSAPKITTQSGQQATIKVVTEYIYPTAFDTSGIGGGGGGALAGTDGGTVGAVVTPLDFQTREVGVILEVTPEVSPEGQMINLLLSPQVVSEPTWRNYGSTYTSFDPNGNPIEQVLNMEQPFFHKRELRTSLLIYNGATVVMGGMITEVRNSVDDKVPFLGDIPILGRAFRSKYESSEKRNLLIFVTARLVDPAGRPIDRERLGIDQGIAERIVGIED